MLQHRRRPAAAPQSGQPAPRNERSHGINHLGAELDEARGGEVAVEGERLADLQRSHQREARRVDERVLALATPSEPAERIRFELLGDEQDREPSSAGDAIEETRRDSMVLPSG